MKTETKDNYFEAIRGICIILVVLIHIQNGSAYKELVAYPFNRSFWLILRQFINFPVAVFVFLTAYFTNITKVNDKPKVYFTSRGKRLLIPFLVWSIFYSAITIAKVGLKGSILKVLIKIMVGQAAAPLYYIVVLMQLVLITPILIKCVSNKYLNLMTFCITPIYLVMVYVYTYLTKQQLPLYGTIFPAWLIFYYLGLYIKINGFASPKKEKASSHAILLVLGALVLSLIEGYILLHSEMTMAFASSQIKASSFIYALSIINLILVLKAKDVKIKEGFIKKDGIITKIGNYSYGIFYVHLFWLVIIEKLTEHIPYIHSILPIYELIQISITLALSILTIIATRKIIGKKQASKYFGF
ncbi:acyltransferase [Clostridium bowmanii]|uniref:acyltransferase n=1 Tax=Clostridium bowmanii TaxID=132925 RepID=UPI001C0D4E09|nr:acyltransferase [Clostridium bowmanii]MBU3188423.1 acyltransferase [Clostridium bowmanii]MCA1072812.1 acyltransferase [Clostridium bowmanii]